jgi:hypothetical protein
MLHDCDCADLGRGFLARYQLSVTIMIRGHMIRGQTA